MRARTGLWEPRRGNALGPPSHERAPEFPFGGFYCLPPAMNDYEVASEPRSTRNWLTPVLPDPALRKMPRR
jgi:hypothetical protein